MKKFILGIICATGLFTENYAQQDWYTTPITIPNGQNATLGTHNNRSLFFVTNDSTRATVDSLGKFRLSDLSGSSSVGNGYSFVMVNDNGTFYRTTSGGGGAINCGAGTIPWLLGGNTVPGNTNANVIGPCNEKDFILQSYGKKSLFIKTNGYVGIGENNNSPSAALDVFDQNAIGNNSPNVDHLRIYGDELGSIEATNSMSMLYNNEFYVVKGQFAGSWQPQLKIDGNGRMGLGTGVGALTYKFTVDAGSVNGILHKTNSSSSQAFSVLNTSINQNLFSVFGDGKTQIGWQSGSSNSAFFSINVNGSNTGQANAIDVYDQNTNAINFRVKSTGSVFCRDLHVKLTSFPDYVFHPNYKLLTLDELKNYIIVNKHLPGIPSEKSIVDSGVDLGELCKLQMEKIEELTLYVLQLKAEIDKINSAKK